MPDYLIEITDSQCHVVLDAEHLRSVARYVLAEEHVQGATISIAIVDNPTLRGINVQYLNHDYDTDVISFLLECDPDPELLPNAAAETGRGRGKRIEGDIAISAEMAAEVATGFGWGPADEVVLYLVHGLLHSVGYDDLSPDEKRLMRSREQTLLSHWDLTPSYSETDSNQDESDQPPPSHAQEADS